MVSASSGFRGWNILNARDVQNGATPRQGNHAFCVGIKSNLNGVPENPSRIMVSHFVGITTRHDHAKRAKRFLLHSLLQLMRCEHTPLVTRHEHDVKFTQSRRAPGRSCAMISLSRAPRSGDTSSAPTRCRCRRGERRSSSTAYSFRKLSIEIPVAANPDPNPNITFEPLRHRTKIARHPHRPETRIRTQPLQLQRWMGGFFKKLLMRGAGRDFYFWRKCAAGFPEMFRAQRFHLALSKSASRNSENEAGLPLNCDAI